MAETNLKPVVLYAYEIDNKELTKSHSDLKEKLSKKLAENKESASNRRMIINSLSNEEDLLSSYSISKQLLFGVMWRIIPQKEVPNIPLELFNHPTITLNDIMDKEGNTLLTCKDHYYFALNEKYIVTNARKSKIKAFEAYINWLLEAERLDTTYSFTPLIQPPKETKLSQIENIVFSQPKPDKKKKQDTASTEDAKSSKVINFALDMLKKVVEDVPEWKTMMENNILSAKLLVKFSQPKKMENEVYRKLLGTCMKPIDDAAGVSFKLKNGTTVTGSNLIVTKTVEVEKVTVGISEPSIRLAMENFLKDLNNVQ